MSRPCWPCTRPGLELRGPVPAEVRRQEERRAVDASDRASHPLGADVAGVARFGWEYLGGAVAWVLLALVFFGLARPDLSARFGQGRPGIWTVTGSRCGANGSCHTWGDFASTDGGPTRGHLALRGAPGPLPPGQRYAAVDVGAPEQVYPPGGGDGWLRSGGLTVLLAAVLTAWLWTVPVRAAKRFPAGTPSG